MKRMRKMMALVLAVMTIMAFSVPSMVFADETSAHTITITNTDQNVSHSYEAYQVFKGKLDANQEKLADIVWGNGVNAANLIKALQETEDTNLAALKTAVASINTTNDDAVKAAASKVAEEVAKFSSTTGGDEASGAIDAFATIVAANLGTKAADFTEGTGENAKKYTASVIGDGYYFIKDKTTTLKGDNGTDTLSKYLLSVVKDTTIEAKDQGLTPEKKIVEDNKKLDANSAAIGDTVTFEVKIKVPNTKKYVDHFVFDMEDKLPAGLTFTGITSVKVGNDNVPYDLYIDGEKQTSFTAPQDPVDANASDADQIIKLVFTNFKAFAETESKNYIGQDMVVTYTAKVNKNANFTSTGNVNEVKFDFSNDPNHTYTGDTPGPNEPMGETPKDKTKTLLTNIELQKTGDNGSVAALEGAEFEITSDDYNTTLVSGEKFEADANGTYYKLKDGSYTETAPTDKTATSYASTTEKYKKTVYSDVVTTPGTNKKVTAITDSNGKIVLKGLKAGTYTIKETKAPSGYNLDNTEYTVVLKVDGTTVETAKIVKESDTPKDKFSFTPSTATASITIDNNSGATLPSTGGMGTTIFYILGALLVVGCGIVLVAKKRTNEK